MPRRIIPFVNNNYYHCFNRGVNKRLIFKQISDYKRALRIMGYYCFQNPPLRYSDFILLSPNEQIEKLHLLHQNKRLVEIICFVFMPNHFHMLLKQREENGISRFMSNFQNSYCRYFNTKYSRVGPLFQGQFKSVTIETNEQLLHVSRYIHLNPSTSELITSEKLADYIWSSYPDYLGKKESTMCTKDSILSQFRTVKAYELFTLEQAAYQKELHKIKDLILDE